MSVTVNDVRNGVIAALVSLYPGVKVYGEEIKQGLVEPWFFVKVLTTGQSREVNRRYKRSNSFDVHYFAKTNEELHEMAESLYGGLEYVTYDGKIYRGSGMTHEIVDRVLHFFVDYNFHVIRDKPDEVKMQTLKQEASFKNGETKIESGAERTAG